MVLRSVIRNFVKLESSSGILLLIAGLLALALSNSTFAGVFDHILHLKLNFGINSALFYKSINMFKRNG